MKWEKVKLGELYTVHNGLSKSRKFFGTGFPFVSFSVVFNNYFLPGELSELVQTTEKEQESYSIRRGDVLITRTSETIDELGMSSVALKDYPLATYNGFTKRMRPINPTRVVPEYIGYYLRNPEFRSKFLAFSTMTTRASLRNEDLLGLEVSLPPLETQNRIASILSAYDDLIENNQKQIKLLEEAAQRLYKEWFVDLRFPGHEDVKIVDGVPEGWKKSQLRNIGEIITGKTPSTSNTSFYGNEIPFVTIPDMHNEVFVLKTGKCLSVAGAESQKSKYIPKDSIMISCIGTVGLVCLSDKICQTNQQINSLVLFNKKDLYYLYHSLLNIESMLDGIGSNGTTMTNVNKEKFSNIELLIPSNIIICMYYDMCKPIFEKILGIRKQIYCLQEARDRLLPKLMSGEIEV